MSASPAHLAAPSFGRYAGWYEAFNAGKDYAAEAEYLLALVRPLQPRLRSWLDVGCGTGEHLAALRAHGIAVEGVDASAAMVAQARQRHPDIPFHVARGQDFRLSPRRDAISLLFHVIDYQVTDEEVDALLGNLAAHLAPDGVLVFDFWHSGGVEADPPAPRVRQASVGGRPLFRLADPTEDRAQRRVDVRYEFRWDHARGELAHEELHRMRHFARQELEGFLGRAGLRPLCCEAWRERRPLRGDDWYGVLCARPAGEAP